jgi:hypothetical protein
MNFKKDFVDHINPKTRLQQMNRVQYAQFAMSMSIACLYLIFSTLE